MIAVLFIWFVILIVCTGLGLAFNKIFLPNGDESLGPGLFITNAFVGISVLIPILAILSLFIRINGELLALLLFISLLIIITQREYFGKMIRLKNFDWTMFLAVLIIPGFLLLYYAILNPGSIGDTLLYHAQCIQWSEKYKAIKGLAHIHNRLAFNNHSLLPFSLFGFSFTHIQTFYCVNSFLMGLLILKCGFEITNSYKKSDTKNLFFYGIVLAASIFLIGERIASPAPDNTTAIYLSYCVILFKEIIKDGKNSLLPVLYLMAFLLPTMKVSTVFVAILPVLASLQFGLHKNFRHWLFVIGIGIFTVFPFFARNMILSGYLVFPLPLDLFNFDWQYFDIERLKMMNRYIINAARITGPRDAGLWTYDMSLVEWFPHWLTWRSPQYYFMNFVLPACILFNFYTLVISFIKKNLTDIFYISFSIFFFISFLYWLFSAPDYRFIWGVLVSGLAIIGYYIFDKFNLTIRWVKYPMLLVPVFVVAFLAFKSVKTSLIVKHLKYPVSIKKIDVAPKQVGPIVVNIPTSKKLGGLCNNALIPCTHHVHDMFEARGNKIIDGFRGNPLLKKPKKPKKKKPVKSKEVSNNAKSQKKD